MSKVQMFAVNCPYCVVGHAIVDVRKEQGAHIADTAPRQCNKCEKYFDIQVKLTLKGVPLDPLDWPTRNKALSQALTKLVTEG